MKPVKARINNSHKHIWSVVWNGQPEDFTDAKNIALIASVRDKRINLMQGIDYVIEGNLVKIDFTPRFCKNTGVYNLELSYSKPSGGFLSGERRTAVDLNVIEIVGTSACADATDETSSVSEAAFGFQGLSAYEVWLKDNPDKTKEDYFNWLQKPATDIAETVNLQEQARVDAENTRRDNEEQRVDAEGVRLSNEQSRVEAEALRVSGEVARNTAEGIRVGNENTRSENEGIRLLAEEDRIEAEETRVENEALRISAELLRKNAESLRVSAESDREDAEQLRQTNTSTAIQNANSAAELANTKAGEANTAAQNADDARLAIEGDLALKANHGYLSNPKTLKQVDDSLDQLAGDVEQLAYVKIKNEVVNGNFENGLISPFNNVDGSGGGGESTLTINSSTPISGNYDIRFTITTPATAGARPYLIGLNRAANIGDKIYLHFDAKILSGTPTINSIQNGYTSVRMYSGDVVNGRNTRIIDVEGTSVNLGLIYFDSMSVVWDMQMDNFMRINLTETFGAGNEPTEEEMDLLISTLGIDYFEGEITIPAQKVMQWQQQTLTQTLKQVDDDVSQLVSDVSIIENDVDTTGVMFKKEYTLKTPAVAAGALKKTGVIDISASSYLRTSITLTGNMLKLIDGEKYAYSGTIDSDLYCGIAYFSASLVFIGWEFGTGVYNRMNLNPPENAAYVGGCGTSGFAIEKVSVSLGDNAIVTNYAPYYNGWNLQGLLTELIATDNTLSISGVAGTGFSFGFDFLLSNSSYKVGDSIHFGARNIKREIGTSGGLLVCVFYNNTSEISRLTYSLPAINYVGVGQASGVIPANTNRILIKFQGGGNVAKITAETFFLTKIIIPDTSSFPEIRKNIFSSQGASNVYVSTTGSDLNSGTFSSPFLTINKAVSHLNGQNGKIIINDGDYREKINLSSVTAANIELVGAINSTARILGSTRIDGWTLTAGKTNVHEAVFTGAINASKPVIFEDGRPSLPIIENERHALQKSNTHRLPFTKITAIPFNADLATTLNDLENSAGKYYHDVANDTLYIHTTDSNNPETNGYSYEYAVRSGISSPVVGSTSGLKLTNLTFLYSNTYGIDLSGFGTVERQWVTVMGAANNGIQESSTFTISYNDEVADCRDGLAGTHAITDNNRERPNITYIAPWSHDNSDDGTSHHSKSNVKTMIGLFEYNGKSGMAPSNSSQWVDHNSICRKNGGADHPSYGEGVEVINMLLAGDNGIGCTFTGYGTICEGNRVGFGARLSDSVRVILHDCVSRNNTDAEYFADAGVITANNCKATNADPSKLKVVSGTGEINVTNDNQLN